MIGTRIRIEVLDTEALVSQDYEFEAGTGPLQVGRDRASAVVLPGASASRRHCEIESRPDGWFIRDLSMLGTMQNGAPVSKEAAQPLRSGDMIACANFQMRVTITATTDPTLKPDPDAIRRLFSEMEAAPPTPPSLWLFTDDSVNAHELPEDGVLTIGRGTECHIRLADPHRVVSAVHARVERNWAGVFLYDASRNGIFVNGNRVEERHALADGDRITVAVSGEDPDRPLLVYAAEGSVGEPAGPGRASESGRPDGAVDPSPSESSDSNAARDSSAGSAEQFLESLGSVASSSSTEISDESPGDWSDRTSVDIDPGRTGSPFDSPDAAGSASLPDRDASSFSGDPEPVRSISQATSGAQPAAITSRESTTQEARKGGLADLVRDNLLIVLVLIVSALALLTVLVWGIVLLRG